MSHLRLAHALCYDFYTQVSFFLSGGLICQGLPPPLLHCLSLSLSRSLASPPTCLTIARQRGAKFDNALGFFFSLSFVLLEMFNKEKGLCNDFKIRSDFLEWRKNRKGYQMKNSVTKEAKAEKGWSCKSYILSTVKSCSKMFVYF